MTPIDAPLGHAYLYIPFVISRRYYDEMTETIVTECDNFSKQWADRAIAIYDLVPIDSDVLVLLEQNKRRDYGE